MFLCWSFSNTLKFWKFRGNLSFKKSFFSLLFTKIRGILSYSGVLFKWESLHLNEKGLFYTHPLFVAPFFVLFSPKARNSPSKAAIRNHYKIYRNLEFFAWVLSFFVLAFLWRGRKKAWIWFEVRQGQLGKTYTVLKLLSLHFCRWICGICRKRWVAKWTVLLIRTPPWWRTTGPETWSAQVWSLTQLVFKLLFVKKNIELPGGQINDCRIALCSS